MVAAGTTRPPRRVRRATWIATATAVFAFALLVTGGSPSGLLERGPFTSAFFDEQASALVDGRLDVDPDAVALEGFVRDGKTYLYFGLVPSVLRMPIVAVTDRFDGRLTQVSMLLALTLACWVAGRLSWRARSWHRSEDDTVEGRSDALVVGAFVLAVGLSSPLLFLASRPLVYHETELWGAATALLAAEAILRWWDRTDGRSLVTASAAVLVALNTRGSVGSGAVAALALTAALACLLRRVPIRWIPALAMAVLIPVGTYAAVNQLRFDHPVDVPFPQQVLSSYDSARQATLEATGGSLFGTEFLPTALVTYLDPTGISLQPLFPWITFVEDRVVIGDAQFDTIDRSTSLPLVAPSLTLLALVGAVSIVLRGRRHAWLPVLVGTAAGLASTLTIAFIAQRYLADFTPVLVLAAAPGAWVIADRLRGSTRALRRAAVTGLVVLTATGTVVSVALALQSQRLFLLPQDGARLGFVQLQYDIHRSLGGGRPPSVRLVDSVPSSPGPRGQVLVDRGCRGLWWSDGRGWVPLELGGDQGLQVAPPFLDGDRTVLLRTSTWSLVVEQETDRFRFRYEGADTRTGPWLPLSSADHPIVVHRDGVNFRLVVRRGDEVLLSAWHIDPTGTLRRDGRRDIGPAATPFCDALRERVDRADAVPSD